MALISVHVDQNTFEEMGVGSWELDKESLEMRGLGKVVVLSGPNGGGKSRILRTVQRVMQKQLSDKQIAEAGRLIRQQQAALVDMQASLQQITSKSDPTLSDETARTQAWISSAQGEIETHQRALRACGVITRSPGDAQPVVFLVPSSARLVDPGGATDDAVGRLAWRLEQGQGSEGAESGAPAYARAILRAALWARNRSIQQPLAHKSSEEERAESLQTMVAEVLGPAFTLELNQSWNISIGGRSDYSNALSPGQQVLFQFVCLLHAQSASLANCIVFMDEPENHLHPAAISRIVAKLSEKITAGQLWIATHSVPLIAQLVATDSDCLWYVADSKAKRAGRTPEIVLDGLMGGIDGARHINELTSLPAQFAGLRFLSECLKDPGVVGPTINDPQLTHISSILAKRRARDLTNKKPQRILDYGAGKGRLLRELKTSGQLQFDYIAYDKSEEMVEQCRQELRNLNSSGMPGRCFSDLHLLASTIDAASIDVIIMCNVLHELPPDEWLRLFGSSGTLTSLLHKNGHLLIVEDYGLPTGERAHEYGFLLLDEQELRPLFCVTEKDDREQYARQASSDPKYKHRLVAHLISQQCVARVTPESRYDAVHRLHARVSDTVKQFLQNRTSGSDAGRSYALNAQLLANSSLWLEAQGR